MFACWVQPVVKKKVVLTNRWTMKTETYNGNILWKYLSNKEMKTIIISMLKLTRDTNKVTKPRLRGPIWSIYEIEWMSTYINDMYLTQKLYFLRMLLKDLQITSEWFSVAHTLQMANRHKESKRGRIELQNSSMVVSTPTLLYEALKYWMVDFKVKF